LVDFQQKVLIVQAAVVNWSRAFVPLAAALEEADSVVDSTENSC
jgi:hypothetical protein